MWKLAAVRINRDETIFEIFHSSKASYFTANFLHTTILKCAF